MLLSFSSNCVIGDDEGGLDRRIRQSVEVNSERDAFVGGLARYVGVSDEVGDGVEEPVGVALLRLGLEVQRRGPR